MEENVKATISHDGIIFFGPGVEELFSHIRETGSVREAASHMGMSYSKAWKLIHQCELVMGMPMVDRTKGGEGGGGSASLTPEGETLLKKYLAYSEEVKKAAHEIYRRHFDEQ